MILVPLFPLFSSCDELNINSFFIIFENLFSTHSITELKKLGFNKICKNLQINRTVDCNWFKFKETLMKLNTLVHCLYSTTDHTQDGSTALTIAMDSEQREIAILLYAQLNLRPTGNAVSTI